MMPTAVSVSLLHQSAVGKLEPVQQLPPSEQAANDEGVDDAVATGGLHAVSSCFPGAAVPMSVSLRAQTCAIAEVRAGAAILEVLLQPSASSIRNC
jgi:hypothetical protein